MSTQDAGGSSQRSRLGRRVAQAVAGRRPSRWTVLLAAAAVAATLSAATGWIIHQERLSDGAVAHTFQNEKQLGRMLSLLQDAEIGQRGYLLTGDRYYLDPYLAALEGVPATLDRLGADMADNARQEANLAVLRTLTAQKLSELRQTVERRQNNSAADALAVLQSGQGKLIMDGLRDVLLRMQTEEERLMALRREAARSSVVRIEIAILALLLLSGALAFLAFRSTLRRARSAEESRDQLIAQFGRKLMAILAADVCGYSSMMERDEAGTLTRLMALRDDIDPIIANHDGRITGSAGDSVLAVFPSALSAVDCAMRMQELIGRDKAQDAIRMRIGINVGDVILQGDDVFGDTVNIAARLEALASPGGICVSRAVRDHVGKQRRLQMDDLGLQAVKNIADPVPVYAIRPSAAG